MKRVLTVLLILTALLVLPVQAAENNTWTVTASVDQGGQVQMSLRVILRMDTLTTRVVIPLGQGAEDLHVNGMSLRVKKVDGIPSAILESRDGFTGTQVFDLSYTLRDCVTGETDWDLVLPLLAEGLAYSIDRLEFQITLPGAVEAVPAFSSGYYGEDVDNYMSVQVEGNVITGSVETTLRDRENLTLTLETDPAVFPRTDAAGRLVSVSTILMLSCLALGAGYWFFRLRWKSVRLHSQSQPPFGVGPGKIRGYLMTGGPELALMVISWAQAGYLTIHLNADQAVTLHKRMDMGSERSAYEQRLFKAVFGHGQLAEASGRSFQALRTRVDGSRLRLRGQFRSDSGNPRILRYLGCAMGFFGGLAMADRLVSSGSGRILLLVPVALLWGGAAWLVQAGPKAFFSWNKRPGLLALAGTGVLLLGGFLSGSVLAAASVCLCQWLLGLAIVLGGRRSEAGRQTVQSILGFRRYLKTMDKKTVNRIMVQNPGYYYDMAAYALALGVDRALARGFGFVKLPRCTWLVTDVPQAGRATEWYPLLRQVAKSLRGELPCSRQSRRLRYEDEVC